METETLVCACGCGEALPRARYPSMQRRFLRGHQHRGEHNGNYRGGKRQRVCAVCLTPFAVFPSKVEQRVTCGSPECSRKWQSLTTAARGINKRRVACSYCQRPLYRFPSQTGERNFCDRFCKSLYSGKQVGPYNGNWRGGGRQYLAKQTRFRDGQRCVVCGFDLSTDVHHITPTGGGGADELPNLVTLCPNHHRLAHIGLIDLEPFRRSDWEPGTPTPGPLALPGASR